MLCNCMCIRLAKYGGNKFNFILYAVDIALFDFIASWVFNLNFIITLQFMTLSWDGLCFVPLFVPESIRNSCNEYELFDADF